MAVRIGILSDQHINVNGIDSLMKLANYGDFLVDLALTQQLNYLVLLGDISWDKKQIDWLLDHLTKKLTGYCELRYVLGNHDLSQNYTLDEFLYPQDSRHLSVSPIVTHGKAFVGFDGFFDFSWSGLPSSQVNQERVLSYANERYFSDGSKLTRDDYQFIVNQQLTTFETQVNSLIGKDIKTIAVGMHFVPHAAFLKPVDSDQTAFKNAYMGSEKYGTAIEHFNGLVTDVYFGHTHRRLGHQLINDVTYHCVPVGIQRSWTLHGFKETDLVAQTRQTLQIIEWNS